MNVHERSNLELVNVRSSLSLSINLYRNKLNLQFRSLNVQEVMFSVTGIVCI